MATVLTDDEFAVPGARPFGDVAQGVAEPVVLGEPAVLQQMLMEGGSEPVRKPGLAVPLPIGLQYPSRTKGRGHNVQVRVHGDSPVAVLCSCDATLSLRERPLGCWAMQEVRRLLNIPDPQEDR